MTDRNHRLLVGDLGRGRAWSPKQAQILLSPRRDIMVDGGRRFGKSEVGAAKFIARVHQRLNRINVQIRRGEENPWPGLGLPKARARHYAPQVDAWVLTPRIRHLEQALAKILRLHSGAYARCLHPDLGLTKGGEELWLQLGGAVARIRFAVGSGAAAVVSGALDELWIDEAGLLDNEIDDAIAPVLWERGGRRICTGTPSLGLDHWFTRRLLAGMDPSHQYYQRDVVERDPDCLTVIGTTYEAYLPDVRSSVVREVASKGSSWESQWVLGDWRLPDLFIYDEFDEKLHVVDYDYRRHRFGSIQLPPPPLVIGVIDYAYGRTNPGACVVFHVWYQSPLESREARRPLVVAVQDHQAVEEYTREGWFATLAELRREYGVRYWLADPSRPDMLLITRKFSGEIGRVVPAEKAHKWDRINLVRAGLHHDRQRGISPALYVHQDCGHLIRQFGRYRRRLSRSGEPTDQTVDYDDHCLDCTAFLYGKIMVGGQGVPRIAL